MKNNQKGITIISLIITIILMLILATITIELGSENIDNSKRMSFVSYMQIIQKKVDHIAENGDYLNYGEELSSNNISKIQTILNNGNENFSTTIDSDYLRYFDNSHIASDLEIDNIDDEIVVDFSTREVISLNGIKYEGDMYYTQYFLPGGQTLKQQSESVKRTVSFENIVSNIDGLNATFTILNVGITNGTLSYGKKDVSGTIKWSTITNYTKEGEAVTTSNFTESGKYYFKLVDNVTGKDNADNEGNYPSVELKLTNEPKLIGNLTDLSSSYDYSDLSKSENWAFAKEQSKSYVWIPRFAYKLNSQGKLEELQFLRGTSDITTSGTYINASDWTESSVFTDGTTKKTGVWVQVNTANQIRCRYN